MQNELDDSHSLEVYIGNVSTPAIIDMLKGRVGAKGFNCVEKLGLTCLRIYFTASVSVDTFLATPFVVGGRELCFFKIGEKVRTVFVKGLPFNLPEKEIYTTLRQYGRVRDIGYERHPGHKPLCTGTRVVKMTFDTPPPNFLRVGKFMSALAYKDQQIVCRRCGGNGHFAKVCRATRDQFKPGFPIHTRPIAPRLGNARKRVSVAVQTVDRTDTVSASKKNSNSVKTSLKATALAQRLNGLRLEGVDEGSVAETSTSVEGSQTEGKNGVGGIPCAGSKTVKQGGGGSAGACAKVNVSPASVTAGDVITVPNVSDNNEPIIGAKKKKKKKKKKPSKQ